MALNLQLVQKQTQRLIMTPQMQQSIQLLQLNSIELEQLVEREMLENPFLDANEEGEESEPTGAEEVESAEIERETEMAAEPPADLFTSGDPEPEGAAAQIEQAADPLEIPDAPAPAADDLAQTFDDMDVNWDEVFSDSENAVYSPPPDDSEDRDFTTFTAAKMSLADYLVRQLRLSALEGQDAVIGEFLIGSVNDDGYLNEPLEKIAEEANVPVADVERVLKVLQTFDPPGVFARNLPECLLLQLEDQGRKTPLAERVLLEHFDQLAKKQFREIAKALEVEEEKIVGIFNEIRRLEPKPGRVRTKEDNPHITPDVYVREVDGELMYSMNEGGYSGLRISKFYRDLLRDRNSAFQGEAREYARERLRSAVMLLKNIEKRKSTILRVAEAIMERQREFLDKGVSAMRPLTLREIAEDVGMHEATISRVTSGKYVETPQGLFELKYFFSSGIGSQSGEASSSRAVKGMIADMIDMEDPDKPLSDEKIMNALMAKGYTIARRTVAKYREQLKILPAKLRKKTD